MSLKEYMKNIKNKINYANNINAKTYDFSNTGYRNTFYNDQENGKVGNRPNRPSDYTTQTQRKNNTMNNIKTSNNFLTSKSTVKIAKKINN